MAVSLSAGEIFDRLGVVDPITRTAALLAVESATLTVDKYAPDAPHALSNEAAVRFTGYLLQADYGTVRAEALGPKSVEYVTNHAAAFRNSGAAALLSPYKHRRGGAA